MLQVGETEVKELVLRGGGDWDTHPDSHVTSLLFFSTQLKGSHFPTTWTSCVGRT